eukprot:1277774-Prymnesium_polylepis.1
MTARIPSVHSCETASNSPDEATPKGGHTNQTEGAGGHTNQTEGAGRGVATPNRGTGLDSADWAQARLIGPGGQLLRGAQGGTGWTRLPTRRRAGLQAPTWG